jgi:hypothetical protein
MGTIWDVDMRRLFRKRSVLSEVEAICVVLRVDPEIKRILTKHKMTYLNFSIIEKK